jgi:hypothetical protein
LSNPNGNPCELLNQPRPSKGDDGRTSKLEISVASRIAHTNGLLDASISRGLIGLSGVCEPGPIVGRDEGLYR